VAIPPTDSGEGQRWWYYATTVAIFSEPNQYRAKYPLPFDFGIENEKILIEYQGIQHYEPVNFGGDHIKIFTDLQEHDRIKRDWCKKYGYKLIAIPYHRFDEIRKILESEVYHP
jgi:hypothetical protein